MSAILAEGLQDVGFADRGVIPLVLRRIALRAATSRTRVSVEALLDLLNQQREPLSGDRAPLRKKGLGLPVSYDECGFERCAISAAERDALREDELLQGVKLVAQLLDRIDVGIRHGLFSCVGDQEATAPDEGAHRLCGGAK
ncbi:hypothetical protein [Erythrobacter sp.]|uniref:hypothetical protein n=1 Tax=Erythrobacter sp. TaxID=1042 RepID=UPI0025DA6335|nr:hypothetical protein [Erythrobacter sp.]